jgi:nucleotide-binding universal stress UspA family protein
LAAKASTGALADGRTMFPPEVWLRAEDFILAQLASQAREMLAQLKTDGVVGDDVVLQAATGDDAIDAADWLEGDLLGIGTSPVGGIARVFLGSRGSKILRHSPVPVLVLPG